MIYPRTKVLERRMRVTTLLVRGVPPGEIAEILGVPRETVYNDIRFIRSGRSEELKGLSRCTMVSMLHLNARERTKELWKVVDEADSDYVKLLALRELRIHDHTVLRNLFVLEEGLKPEGSAVPEHRAPGSAGEGCPEAPRLSRSEYYERRFRQLRDEFEKALKVGDTEVEPAETEATHANQGPPCQSVKTRHNPLSDKELQLQMEKRKISPKLVKIPPEEGTQRDNSQKGIGSD